MTADRSATATKLRTLRGLLECALDEHEGDHGRFAPDFLPKHWTHAARKALKGRSGVVRK